ncbi:RBR-type E3 ubiquitin transferase [Entamoeba marina]
MEFVALNFDELLTVDRDQQKVLLRKHIQSYRELTAPREDPKLECEICFDDVDVSFFYKNPNCGHGFCLPCISEHVTKQINDANTVVKCPSGDCKQDIPYNDLVNCGIIHDKVLLDKYTNTLTRMHIDKDPNTRYCEKCGTAMIGTRGLTLMRCSKCNYAFCFKCKEPWHADCTCEQYRQWKIDNAKGDDAYAEFIKNHTKPCPKCRKPIQKNGGCNHMTCTCGHQFCWICLGVYGPGHFSHGRCRQFS